MFGNFLGGMLSWMLVEYCWKIMSLKSHEFWFQFGQHAFDPAGMPFGSQAPREYSRGSSPEWLHMQVGGGFERTT